MDFHGLKRKQLQELCKKNGIRANMTNIAMADALQSLQTVEGILSLEEATSPPEQIRSPITRSSSLRNNTRPPVEHEGSAISIARGGGEMLESSLAMKGSPMPRSRIVRAERGLNIQRFGLKTEEEPEKVISNNIPRTPAAAKSGRGGITRARAAASSIVSRAEEMAQPLDMMQETLKTPATTRRVSARKMASNAKATEKRNEEKQEMSRMATRRSARHASGKMAEDDQATVFGAKATVTMPVLGKEEEEDDEDSKNLAGSKDDCIEPSKEKPDEDIVKDDLQNVCKLSSIGESASENGNGDEDDGGESKNLAGRKNDGREHGDDGSYGVAGKEDVQKVSKFSSLGESTSDCCNGYEDNLATECNHTEKFPEAGENPINQDMVRPDCDLCAWEVEMSIENGGEGTDSVEPEEDGRSAATKAALVGNLSNKMPELLPTGGKSVVYESQERNLDSQTVQTYLSEEQDSLSISIQAKTDDIAVVKDTGSLKSNDVAIDEGSPVIANGMEDEFVLVRLQSSVGIAFDETSSIDNLSPKLSELPASDDNIVYESREQNLDSQILQTYLSAEQDSLSISIHAKTDDIAIGEDPGSLKSVDTDINERSPMIANGMEDFDLVHPQKSHGIPFNEVSSSKIPELPPSDENIVYESEEQNLDLQIIQAYQSAEQDSPVIANGMKESYLVPPRSSVGITFDETSSIVNSSPKIPELPPSDENIVYESREGNQDSQIGQRFLSSEQDSRPNSIKDKTDEIAANEEPTLKSVDMAVEEGSPVITKGTEKDFDLVHPPSSVRIAFDEDKDSSTNNLSPKIPELPADDESIVAFDDDSTIGNLSPKIPELTTDDESIVYDNQEQNLVLLEEHDSRSISIQAKTDDIAVSKEPAQEGKTEARKEEQQEEREYPKLMQTSKKMGDNGELASTWEDEEDENAQETNKLVEPSGGDPNNEVLVKYLDLVKGFSEISLVESTSDCDNGGEAPAMLEQNEEEGEVETESPDKYYESPINQAEDNGSGTKADLVVFSPTNSVEIDTDEASTHGDQIHTESTSLVEEPLTSVNLPPESELELNLIHRSSVEIAFSEDSSANNPPSLENPELASGGDMSVVSENLEPSLDSPVIANKTVVDDDAEEPLSSPAAVVETAAKLWDFWLKPDFNSGGVMLLPETLHGGGDEILLPDPAMMEASRSPTGGTAAGKLDSPDLFNSGGIILLPELLQGSGDEILLPDPSMETSGSPTEPPAAGELDSPDQSDEEQREEGSSICSGGGLESENPPSPEAMAKEKRIPITAAAAKDLKEAMSLRKLRTIYKDKIQASGKITGDRSNNIQTEGEGKKRRRKVLGDLDVNLASSGSLALLRKL